MTTPLDTLALTDAATATMRGPASRAGSDAGSWRREMERAQTQDWFRGAVAYAEHGAGGAQGVMAERAAEPTALPHRHAEMAGTITASAQRVAMQAMRIGLEAGAFVTAPLEAGAEAGGSSGTQGQTVVATPEAMRAAATGTPAAHPAGEGGWLARIGTGQAGDASEALPLRLHLEVDEAGARLWVGTTAASGEQIDQAVAEVRRRLAMRGITLTDVTCNGKPWNQNLTAHTDVARRAHYPTEEENHGIDR